MEGTARENISIPHQLLPATNQPSQGGRVSVTREQPPMTAGSEGQNSPLPPQKFRKTGDLPSTPLLIRSACY